MPCSCEVKSAKEGKKSMQLQIVAPILGIVGLVIAFVIYNYIKSQPAGNEKMVEIAEEIQKGAMAFLKREYKVCLLYTSDAADE